MRKLINLIALLIMASSVTWAQDKKSFTLEDLMPGGNNYYNLLPQNLYGLQWWGDVCINADIEEVKTIQPANGKENVLITLQEVNELLANKELGKINHFRNASFPYAEKMMLVNTTSNKVLIDLTKKEIIWSQPLSPKAANQDWNKESRSLAYTLDNNLFVTTADGENATSHRRTERHRMRTKCTPSGIWYLERYFLESERKSACFLPHGRKHGNRLSTSKYLHPHSDTGAGQVSDGRNDQPQSDCRHLQSGDPKNSLSESRRPYRPLFYQYQLES